MTQDTTMPVEWNGKEYPFDFEKKRYEDLENGSMLSFGEDDEPVPQQSMLSRRTKLIVLGVVLLFVSGATAGGIYSQFTPSGRQLSGVLAADNTASTSPIESATIPTPTTSSIPLLPTSSTIATTSPISESSISAAAIVTVALLQETAASTPSPSPSPSSSSSSAPSPSPSVVQSNDASLYMTSAYHGVATHFPGSSISTAALACGDAYTHPSTTLFAALCKSTFDIFPGTTSIDLLNSNKSPVCGAYVDGRKGIDGAWITRGNGVDWAVVGGDGALSCVGTESVRCHVPRTITITHGSTVVKNVMIVDRNQGLGGSPCSPGDVDASDEVYRLLAGTTADDANAGLGINVEGISWVWE